MKFASFGVVSLGLATVLLIGTASGIASSFIVAAKAKVAAGGAPFCIQIADGGDYKPARSLSDLSVSTMRADSNGYLRYTHHAILAVGTGESPRLFHWSYRKRDFVPGVMNERVPGGRPAIVCEVSLAFIENLPRLFPNATASAFIRFGDREAYRIPTTYQPRWSGGVSRHLTLAAAAPDFAPLKTSLADLPPLERSQNSIFIQWKNPDWLLAAISSPQRGDMVEQTSEFGLRKQLTVTYGKDGKKYESYRYSIIADAQADGINTTLLECSAGSDLFPPSCRHQFLNGGHQFSFRHSLENVSRWREVQNRLVNLLASFEVRNTDVSKTLTPPSSRP